MALRKSTQTLRTIFVGLLECLEHKAFSPVPSIRPYKAKKGKFEGCMNQVGFLGYCQEHPILYSKHQYVHSLKPLSEPSLTTRV